MHDALTVSEYPAIPTRFQAQVVTQSGKNTSKQSKKYRGRAEGAV